MKKIISIFTAFMMLSTIMISCEKEEKTYIMDKVFFEKKKAKKLLQMRQFQMTATKTKSTH